LRGLNDSADDRDGENEDEEEDVQLKLKAGSGSAFDGVLAASPATG